MSSRRTDLLVAAVGAALCAATVLIWSFHYEAVIPAAILGATLGGSRRYPRATWTVASLMIVLWAVVDLSPNSEDFVTFVILGAHAFSAGRWDPYWQGVGGLVALTVAGLIAGAATAGSLVPVLLITIGAWTPGRSVRSRVEVAEQLAERVRDLEEEREAYAALSVRYERARIASELHDIVAHALSVMVVQASAGQRLMAADPDSASETFEAIAAAAHEAEDDMKRLVDLLSDDDGIGPAPDLQLVEELVARAAGSGLDVTLRLEGEREGFPPAIGALAYRVVQEGITNALRYASGATVRVMVNGARDELWVSVANGPPPATRDGALTDVGTGNGLRGLRERVGAAGGVLDAGPTPDHGWRVAAILPRRVTAKA